MRELMAAIVFSYSEEKTMKEIKPRNFLPMAAKELEVII
jgi:hypothetical protein